MHVQIHKGNMFLATVPLNQLQLFKEETSVLDDDFKSVDDAYIRKTYKAGVPNHVFPISEEEYTRLLDIVEHHSPIVHQT